MRVTTGRQFRAVSVATATAADCRRLPPGAARSIPKAASKLSSTCKATFRPYCRTKSAACWRRWPTPRSISPRWPQKPYRGRGLEPQCGEGGRSHRSARVGCGHSISPAPPAPYGDGPRYHHIGLYAYRRAALEHFVRLPPSLLEVQEKLEQLRALEAGLRIDVTIVDTVPRGVDTPADLETARNILSKA